MQTGHHSHHSAFRGTEQFGKHFRPRAVADLGEYQVEDDLVLYDPRDDVAHILNSTAAIVWWLCDGKSSTDEISVRIAKLYGMDSTALAEEVLEILCEFWDARLVVGR